MSKGRPELPAELKAFRGTINPTREKQAAQIKKNLNRSPLIFDDTINKITCPKSITDSYVRKFWKNYTNALLSVRALGAGDIPQFTRLCLLLQKIREIESVFITLAVDDEEFDAWERRYYRLCEHFDKLASKFYLTPAERAKMKIDALTIREKEMGIDEKERSAIGNLLNARKNAQ